MYTVFDNLLVTKLKKSKNVSTNKTKTLALFTSSSFSQRVNLKRSALHFFFKWAGSVQGLFLG